MERFLVTIPNADVLLKAQDPAAVRECNADGASPFLLIGDHAGNAIPAALGDLGVSDQDRRRHIAWDIGIKGLGARLAERLDAAFIFQAYSRLVVDCNRNPESPEAIVERSDGIEIPGNIGLAEVARRRRVEAIHQPYHRHIAGTLDARAAAGRPTILVALHSFTPVMDEFRRPWEIGLLHSGGETDFVRVLLASLREDSSLTVGDNEPYRMDLTDYTIPFHAFDRTLPYAEIEIRQDLIEDPAGQQAWSGRLAVSLEQARARTFPD